ncbi:MAG: o-succinylbenzoate synthase [Snowella sp.]|nr:o-succinylbenzoate synthase [Snowella sp.]
MDYYYDYFVYCKPFVMPLQTCHGLWSERKGIIIQLTDQWGNVGRGEIAPLSWFGSETIEQATQFCAQLGAKFNPQIIDQIPNDLPCCQFAFESALINLKRVANHTLITDLDHHLNTKHEIDSVNHPWNYSYLLPTGLAALPSIQTNVAQQYNTFKQKIGVQSFEQERSLIKELISYLPTQGKLRLDANGGLNLETTKRWLEFAELENKIELIEQPLPPEEFPTLLALSRQFKTAIALDESVANLTQLQSCYQQGWRGVYVLKAAIMGSPRRLGQWLQTHPIDALFSSVFETAIGRQNVLELAIKWGNPSRALGFGVNHWFQE